MSRILTTVLLCATLGCATTPVPPPTLAPPPAPKPAAAAAPAPIKHPSDHLAFDLPQGWEVHPNEEAARPGMNIASVLTADASRTVMIVFVYDRNGMTVKECAVRVAADAVKSGDAVSGLTKDSESQWSLSVAMTLPSQDGSVQTVDSIAIVRDMVGDPDHIYVFAAMMPTGSDASLIATARKIAETAEIR